MELNELLPGFLIIIIVINVIGDLNKENKDKFTFGLFLIGENDWFTTITTSWKRGFRVGFHLVVIVKNKLFSPM